MGNELIATAASDLFFRWTPSGEWSMMRVHHPLPGMDLDASPTARFGGYPPASSPAGAVVADDVTYRFLAVLDGIPHNRWHLDVNTSLGVPAVDRGIIYTGAGGHGATRSIVAIDSGTGTPLWSYAPEGLPTDPVQMVRKTFPKSFTVALQGAAAPGGKRTTYKAGSRIPDSALRGPLREVRQTISISTVGPESPMPHGHWTNSGLVIRGGRIYGEVNGAVVALDQATGSERWRRPLENANIVRSMVATPDHLVLCVSAARSREPMWEVQKESDNRLMALRLDNGKVDWEQRVPRPGNLALAGGMLFFADGDLHVYGPAERTFLLAADSPHAGDYGQSSQEAPTLLSEREEGSRVLLVGTAPEKEAPEKAAGAEAGADRKKGPLADATILRLSWNLSEKEMLQKIRARREAATGVPMVLSLDRLNAERSEWVDAIDDPPFTPAWVKYYASICRLVAAAAKPEHFDILPEINVYLARFPKELARVRELVRTLAHEVHEASPETKVVVSMNCEVLDGTYGKGTYRPFGKLEVPMGPVLDRALPVTLEADEVGLTSYPQAAFTNPSMVPPTYLTDFKPAFGEKPVLITGLALRVGEKTPTEFDRAWFLSRVLHSCYWLNARVVAYPDLVTDDKDAKVAEFALRIADRERMGLSVWREVFAWKKVDRLTLAEDEPTGSAPGTGLPGSPPGEESASRQDET